MTSAQVELEKLPSEVASLLDRVPAVYMHDRALDLAWAAMVAAHRPAALHQVIHNWEITL